MTTKELRTLGEASIQSSLDITENDTIIIPAGYLILGMTIRNTTSNSVTGGLRMGTIDGGSDVMTTLAVPGDYIAGVPDALLLKKFFSVDVDTPIYVQAVAAWNNASLNIKTVLAKIV